eukprot:TRINITY_DN7767_c0_g1_i7.p2 TRINITY_DN7767_c0_g1~~TRINITY_DN7767_c0_g1_i7.p2  ORF type:complete len:109 (-),score=28.05 TRINITY_DN7767_c0_g1_i7:34-360(-)
MCGDANLYFHNYFDADTAEIEVMIAEKASRQKGIAQEVLKILMRFCAEVYKRDKFIAKIKNYNTASIKLFEKLGYTKFKDLPQFDEVHYEYTYQPCLLYTSPSPRDQA